MLDRDRDFLISLFNEAIAAADPIRAIAKVKIDKPKGQTVVVGAGKGVAQLAAAFETTWDGPLSGVVVTRYGYSAPCQQIRVLEAGHPVPDEAGLVASAALLKAVEGLTADDLVVALVCGGGSALLPAPPAGLTLRDEEEINKILLSSGAPIGVMNAIRKHVSMIKGGRLAAAAYPARVVSMIVSDVPGDDPAQVASGPTVPDYVSVAQALDLVEVHNIALPPRIIAHLHSKNAHAPMPNDPCFQGNEVHVIASAGLSLEAAGQEAERRGVNAVILSDAIEGEARDVGQVHAAIARQVVSRGRPFAPPVVILSGGETTVTLRHKGKGGRNSEFLLSFANAISGMAGIAALAADTDGIDGSEDNAGAFADGATEGRIRTSGIDPARALAENDSWTAFSAIDALFVPGPTGTNINDFRAIFCIERD